MAVDTAQKRAAMLNFGFGDIVLPPPDSSIDAGDRAILLGLYSNLSSPVVPDTILNSYDLTGRQGARSATGQQGAAAITGKQGAASITGKQGERSATGKEPTITIIGKV